mmetsp:Transcript_120110/g.285362  ORF Transcript_120110/g.285362 Transcript_120110/m.285362 type:complete len:134 (+) Transcript_120110:1320-1721(+)
MDVTISGSIFSTVLSMSLNSFSCESVVSICSGCWSAAVGLKDTRLKAGPEGLTPPGPSGISGWRDPRVLTGLLGVASMGGSREARDDVSTLPLLTGTWLPRLFTAGKDRDILRLLGAAAWAQGWQAILRTSLG